MKKGKIIVFTIWCILVGTLYGYLHFGTEGCYTIFHIIYSAFLYFIGFITLSIGIVWTLKKINNNSYKISFLPTIATLTLFLLFIFEKIHSYGLIKQDPILSASLENHKENTFFTLSLNKGNKFEFRHKMESYSSMVCSFRGKYQMHQDTLELIYNLSYRTYDTYFDRYFVTSTYVYPIENGIILDNPDRRLKINKVY
jgi:hypothetical protein